jgi:small subunit ribosomal protein S16
LPVHIRLRRIGKKGHPFYRIVAADSRRARDGRFLEVLGHYNPVAKPAEITLFEDRLATWLDNGAQTSDTVGSLLTQVGFTEKYHQAKSGADVSTIAVKKTIRERPKKTRRMKKATVAAESAAAATAAPAETPSEKPAGE